MIIIKDTPLADVISNIAIEQGSVTALRDTLAMIQSSSDIASIEKYLTTNAVLRGIVNKAKTDISSRHDFFTTLSYTLTTASKLLEDIKKRFQSSKTRIFDTTTISYREKGMFDWISAINFLSGYTSKLFDIVLTQPKDIARYLTKADFEYINKTWTYYLIVMKRLSAAPLTLTRSLDLLSDAPYDPENDTLLAQLRGRDAIDNGLAPHKFNPYYWLNYGVMLRNVSRIKSNRESIDLYAMKLQKLEQDKQGNSDPAIDRQIEYWQNEIRILDAEIANIEEKYRG